MSEINGASWSASTFQEKKIIDVASFLSARAHTKCLTWLILIQNYSDGNSRKHSAR